MATIEARGYVNKPESKVSAGGMPYNKFTLAVQQKRKGKDGQEVKEKLYFNCLDFSGGACPADGTYTGVTGYAIIYPWASNGKSGINVDVTVKSYETLKQRAPAGGGSRDAEAPPSDPFKLQPDADLGKGK